MAKASRKTSTAPAATVAFDAAVLASIVSATAAGGFLHVPAEVSAPMASAGLVEVNPEIRDENGNLATRATEAGANYIASQSSGVVTTAAASQPDAANRPSFEIEDNVPMPTIKRGGAGGTVYPFDSLNVGQSFHIPATPERPNPAKSLASTVSSATARYAVEARDAAGNIIMESYEVKDEAGNVTGTSQRPQMVNTRVFSVRTVGADDPKGAGARVWRTV